MSDITKCVNGCEKKETCYRWLAPSHEFRQSYSYFKPDENGNCKEYWEVNNE